MYSCSGNVTSLPLLPRGGKKSRKKKDFPLPASEQSNTNKSAGGFGESGERNCTFLSLDFFFCCKVSRKKAKLKLQSEPDVEEEIKTK